MFDNELSQALGFVKIVEAKAAGNLTLLNEISLSRVYEHVKNARLPSFAILTSYRAGRTPSDNKSLFGRLQQQLRSANLGFFRLIGHWQECQDGSDYQSCPADKLVDVTEPSLFVPGIGSDLAADLAASYEQDAYLYSGPETNNVVQLRMRGGDAIDLGKFNPGKIRQAYSSLRGRPFVFEYIAQDFQENMIAEAMRRTR